MKYLITISYDGSKFNGLQKLNNKLTVQGVLEDVLTRLNEEKVLVKASGRTDKGVHALNQKCHFELKKEITPYKLRYYINRETPKYLYVKDCTIISNPNFHARFSVKSKTYLYKINIGEYNPILADYIYNYNKNLNLNLIIKAAKKFEGIHSFKPFVSGKHDTYESEIYKIDAFLENNIVNIRISGKAFYTYMVRHIIGILILVGAEKVDMNIIDEMFFTQKKVIEYAIAPASGLYLENVFYE